MGLQKNKEALKLHSRLKGKIEIRSKIRLSSKKALSLAYTPGVAGPCIEIFRDRKNVYKYTAKANTVAVVTDGSAVLGLGSLGAEASLPVMEGKCMIFREFGGIDAFPIALATHDPEEIIRTVKLISPGFGGINLEDIKAPECFEIERRLRKELDIPVFHDDQHGTAIVVLAGLINAAKATKRNLRSLKVLVNGAGAAGIAISSLLLKFGLRRITILDSRGTIHRCRHDLDLNNFKKKVAMKTSDYCLKRSKRGHGQVDCSRCMNAGLDSAIVGKDAFIGVSKAGLLKSSMVRSMSSKPIVFALANPVPEISYSDAIKAGAAVAATGSSDSPNQINNMLAFPSVFRGAFDAGASEINDEMKIAAAVSLAGCIPPRQLNTKKIIPDPLEKRIYGIVSRAVRKAALDSSAARK